MWAQYWAHSTMLWEKKIRLLFSNVIWTSLLCACSGTILRCLFRCNVFTVGTHSHCLRLWEHPLGEIEGFFYKVKVVHTNRGPKREGKIEEIIFFYGKLASLGWDPDRWRWMDGGQFFDYTTKDGRDSIIKRNPGTTRAADE